MITRTNVVTFIFVAALGAVPGKAEEAKGCGVAGAEVELFRREVTLPEYEWTCKGSRIQVSGFGVLELSQQGTRTGAHFLDLTLVRNLDFLALSVSGQDETSKALIRIAPTLLAHKAPLIGRSTRMFFEGLRISPDTMVAGHNRRFSRLFIYETKHLGVKGVEVFSEGLYRQGNDQGELHFWGSNTFMRQHRVWVGGVLRVDTGSVAFKSGLRIVLKR